ncbi:MAG: hypothetical protein CFE32_05550 [Alphaproteobacteria bacterium PA3]|nr:MAG: hypothetical protein CFE32_05550 [Alphaproteobacteria bacterium PA3]
MTDKDVEATVLHLLQRDHAVTLGAADLETLTPDDVGLDSLSQAELYMEISDQLGILQIESPKGRQTFRDIIRHFQSQGSN